MVKRKRSYKGWIAFSLILVLALVIFGTRIPCFKSVISDIKALGIGDRANLVIASMATFAFLISIWQSTYSVRVNNRNNELAKDQREQSALDNKRTYDLMLLQMNRANRVQLYVPLLAWMRGVWYDFDQGVKSIPPQVDPYFTIFETHVSNLDSMKRLILTFEFEAEMDLVASQGIQEAIDSWKPKMISAGELLDKLNSKIDSIEGDAEASKAFAPEQASVKKELELKSRELVLDLNALEEMIRVEIEMPKD